MCLFIAPSFALLPCCSDRLFAVCLCVRVIPPTLVIRLTPFSDALLCHHSLPPRLELPLRSIFTELGERPVVTLPLHPRVCVYYVGSKSVSLSTCTTCRFPACWAARKDTCLPWPTSSLAFDESSPLSPRYLI